MPVPNKNGVTQQELSVDVRSDIHNTAKPIALRVLDAKESNYNYAALEVLKDIDGLFIRQEWEVLEGITQQWYEQANEYTVLDKSGKVELFKAKEKTSCCYRMCCGENRPFSIKVYDTVGQKDKAAMLFERKYRCCGWAVLPCCAHRVDVHYLVDANGQTIGSHGERTLISTVQVPPCTGGCCCPTWHINDRHGNKGAEINGSSCCVCDMCGADFSVQDRDGNTTGEIKKLAPSSLKSLAIELTSDADTYKVSFARELDPQLKMAIIAATLQIDFTFFEDSRGPCQCRCCDCWCCGWAAPCLPACIFALLAFICCQEDAKAKKKRESEEKKKQGGAPETEEMVR